MASWLTSFLLGRPGYEYSFTINPTAMSIDEQPVDIVRPNLAGDLKKTVVKSSAPVIKINSTYLTKAQRDQFASLAGITDTFLSFQTRDDWQVLQEKDTPTTITTVTLQNTSATRLSAALVAAGFASQITINHVWQNPNGTGTDYLNGGTYADATRIVTLGSSVPVSLPAVYIDYTYKGWLMNLSKFTHSAEGGKVDLFTYDYSLEGA